MRHSIRHRFQRRRETGPAVDSADLRIEKLVPGGDGLARLGGQVVFIPGTLPGEKVRARVQRTRKDFARADLDAVLEPSPDRVIPACPHYERCGGCDWQHIRSEAQAPLKAALLRDALRRVGGIDWPEAALEVEAGQPFGYRNRVQVHADGQGRAGFKERNGESLVPIASCPVAHPSLQSIFSDPPAAAGRFLAYGPDAEGKSHREDREPAAEIHLEWDGVDLVFPLAGFFQSNAELFRSLWRKALEGWSGETFLDLYSGVGVFAALAKRRFSRVICVEQESRALPYARRNVGDAGAACFHAMDADAFAQLSPAEQGLPSGAARFAHILVDPPRTGLSPFLKRWLAAQRPERLAYVSCHPVTFARDLKDLLAAGLRLESVRGFDFYPQTAHLECLALLTASEASAASAPS